MKTSNGASETTENNSPPFQIELRRTWDKTPASPRLFLSGGCTALSSTTYNTHIDFKKKRLQVAAPRSASLETRHACAVPRTGALYKY